jgi:glycosyltransferase involved in cell wall biosynthesis
MDYRRIEIVARHFSLTVVTPDGPDEGVLPLGVDAISWRRGLARRAPRSSRMLFASIAAARAARELDASILCQSPHEAAIVRCALRRSPVRVVAEVHGDWRIAATGYGTRRRRLAFLLDRLAVRGLRRADVVRTVSSWLEREVAQVRPRGPVLVFPPYCELEDLVAGPVQPMPEPVSVGYLGGLERCKGIDMVLAVWSEVVQSVPSARLLIAGSGSLEADVRNAAAADPSIEYVGRLDRADVGLFIDRTTAVVVPSVSEGFGRVPLEVMARGRVAVVTPVGGLVEVAQAMGGCIVTRSVSSEAVGESLARVLSAPGDLANLAAGGREAVAALDLSAAYETGMAELAALLAP